MRKLRAPIAAGLVFLSLVCTAHAAAAAEDDATPRRPHIFLLNIDMLRADHLGVHGYARNTSPTLDRIAREGVWFTAARSHAPWTYPSVVSLLSGVHPTSHGSTYAAAGDSYVTTTVPTELDTLATVLQAGGYSTAAFITNPLLKRSSGLARGFDEFQDQFVGTWKRTSTQPWKRDSMTADNVHRAVLEWLPEKTTKPLFAYIHYIDVHGPYLTPRAFGRSPGSVTTELAEKARLSGDPQQVAVDVYDGELLHLDRLIGEFLETLSQRGILQDSIVMITADHGEEFGDHGNHGHGHTLYEEMLHVPLMLMRTHALPHQRRIDAPVGQVDVMPTLLELAGLATPERAIGQSLVPAIRNGAPVASRPILSEMDNRGRPVWNSRPGDPKIAYALLFPPAEKYILGSKGPLGPIWRLRKKLDETFFDLAADPRERTPLQVSEDRKKQARDQLNGILDHDRSVALEPGTATLDESTKARLRALGYLPDADPTEKPPHP